MSDVIVGFMKRTRTVVLVGGPRDGEEVDVLAKDCRAGYIISFAVVPRDVFGEDINPIFQVDEDRYVIDFEYSANERINGVLALWVDPTSHDSEPSS